MKTARIKPNPFSKGQVGFLRANHSLSYSQLIDMFKYLYGIHLTYAQMRRQCNNYGVIITHIKGLKHISASTLYKFDNELYVRVAARQYIRYETYLWKQAGREIPPNHFIVRLNRSLKHSYTLDNLVCLSQQMAGKLMGVYGDTVSSSEDIRELAILNTILEDII